MKLYLVKTDNFGTMRRASLEGSQRFASTNKAEALRRWKTERKRLNKKGVRFHLTLFEIETPNHVGSETWIEFLETGDIESVTFKIIDKLRQEEKEAVA